MMIFSSEDKIQIFKLLSEFTFYGTKIYDGIITSK